MKTDLKKPYRFIDEYSQAYADNLIEHLLECPKLRQDLVDFATGFTDPQQLLYEIQVRIENVDAAIQESNAESRKYGSYE